MPLLTRSVAHQIICMFEFPKNIEIGFIVVDGPNARVAYVANFGDERVQADLNLSYDEELGWFFCFEEDKESRANSMTLLTEKKGKLKIS